MSAQPTIEMHGHPLHLPLRRISISTMYAWTRVLDAYKKRHPGHDVDMLYHHISVRDLKLLVRHTPDLDPHGFAIRVNGGDPELDDVPLLIARLQEAAGEEMAKYVAAEDPDSWFAKPAKVDA